MSWWLVFACVLAAFVLFRRGRRASGGNAPAQRHAGRGEAPAPGGRVLPAAAGIGTGLLAASLLADEAHAATVFEEAKGDAGLGGAIADDAPPADDTLQGEGGDFGGGGSAVGWQDDSHQADDAGWSDSDWGDGDGD